MDSNLREFTLNSAKLAPLDFQNTCIDFLVNGPKNTANFSDMGTGKSMSMLHAVRYLTKHTKINKIIIVCPKSVKRTWQVENYKHLKQPFDFQIIKTGKDKFDKSKDGYIINYDLLKKKQKELKPIVKNSILILDETQKICNRLNARSKAVFSLFEETARTFLLTGTPIQNKPENVWSILYILNKYEIDGQYSFSYYKFLNTYCVLVDKRIVGYKRLDRIAEMLKKYSIRFTKDILDLPPIFYNTEYTELSSDQLELYMSMKKELIAFIKDKDHQTIAKQAVNILSQITRLLQICSNPALIGHHSLQIPAKINLLDELLEEHIEQNGEKVIISTIFRETNNYICNRYKNYNPGSLMGGLTEKQQSEIIDGFQVGDINPLVIHPEVGGIGQTLTAGNIIIFYDRNFSLAHYLQAVGRIHRISQINTCYVINLIAENTIEEHVDALLHWKEVMSKEIVSETEKKTFQGMLMYLLDDERSNSSMSGVKFSFSSVETQNASETMDKALAKINKETLENISAGDIGGIENTAVDVLTHLNDDEDEDEIIKVLCSESKKEPVQNAVKNAVKEREVVQELPNKTAELIHEAVKRLEFNLGNNIRAVDEGMQHLLVTKVLPELAAIKKIQDDILNKMNQIESTPSPKKESRKKAVDDIKTGTEFNIEQAEKAAEKREATKNKELAVVLDRILKKNNLVPPWDLSSEEHTNMVKTYLRQKNIILPDEKLQAVMIELVNLKQ